jgi:hypothetical protein
MVKYFIVCFSLAIILRSIIGTEATQGIDVSQPASTEIFSCLKQTGYDFAIVRAFRSSGMPDYNAPQTIRNARQANFATVEAYMFPCPKCGNAQKQVCVSFELYHCFAHEETCLPTYLPSFLPSFLQSWQNCCGQPVRKWKQ